MIPLWDYQHLSAIFRYICILFYLLNFVGVKSMNYIKAMMEKARKEVSYDYYL
jgi:hypothetical protein